MTQLLYIANIRLPTEKAHGGAIMRMCDAFAHTGVSLRLVATRRYTSLTGDPFKLYGTRGHFPISYLWVVDLFPLRWVRASIAYWVATLTFYVSLFFWLLFRSRRHIIYTRDTLGLACALLGFRVVYECHALSHWRKTFFFVTRRAYRIVVISEALKKRFVAAGFAPERILVVASGVDVGVFAIDLTRDAARDKLSLPKETFIALYTGSFTTMGADKGLYDVVEALRFAPRVHLLAVGGSPYDVERYGKKAEECGVADRVSLIGYTRQRTLALYQRAADCFLAPFPDKPHYRNHMSPMKLVEYRAGRRPIIATDLPTIREVVSEQTALIVPPDSPQALGEAMQRICEHPEQFAAQAGEAFKGIERYSWDERARLILKFVS